MEDQRLNVITKFFNRIGIINSEYQEGISMFWTIAASVLIIAFFILLIVKFGYWLF
jgi:hypothetical protein